VAAVVKPPAFAKPLFATSARRPAAIGRFEQVNVGVVELRDELSSWRSRSAGPPFVSS
jgi:hypothetical protein